MEKPSDVHLAEILTKLEVIDNRLSKVERHCRFIVIQETSSISYQLAESISGVLGLKEAITANHRYLRYAWGLLLMIGIGATMYFLYATADAYLSEPTWTKVTLESQPNYTFPPVVLCNDAWFDTEKALQLGLSIDAFKYSLGYWKYEGELDLVVERVNNSKTEFLSVYQRRNFSDLIAYYKAIALDMIQSNSLGAFVNENSSTYFYPGQSSRSARMIFLPAAAICYEFALHPVHGRWGFLFDTATIFLKYEDKSGDLMRLSPDWAVYLSNDARSMYVWPLIIRSGTTSYVLIKQQRFIRYNAPKVPCTNQNGYTVAVCFLECYQRMIKDKGECASLAISAGTKAGNPTDFCNFFDSESSDHTAWTDDATELADHCSGGCPRKCERVVYEATLAGSDHLRNDYPGAKALLGTDQSNLSITTISIRHDAIYQGGLVTTAEAAAYTFTALISNVGGCLGLFVGGTVMTFVQLIMFVVNHLCEKRVGKLRS